MKRLLFCIFMLICFHTVSILGVTCLIGIKNVTVIQMESNQTVSEIASQDVYFKDSIVKVVSNNSTVDEAPIVFMDGSGKYLMPAVIDSSTEVLSLRYSHNELLTLLKGLSAIVNVGIDDTTFQLLPYFFFISRAAIIVSNTFATEQPSLAAPYIAVRSPSDVAHVADDILNAKPNNTKLVLVLMDSDFSSGDSDSVAILRALNGALHGKVKLVAQAASVASANVAMQYLKPDALSETPIGFIDDTIAKNWTDTVPHLTIFSNLNKNYGAAVDNLKMLIKHNATVVYASGNGNQVGATSNGINLSELKLLETAFNNGTDKVLQAVTHNAYKFWSETEPIVAWESSNRAYPFTLNPHISNGSAASFILTSSNPRTNILTMVDALNRYFVLGNELFCSKCLECPKESSYVFSADIIHDNTVEIVISVIVPIIFVCILLLMAAAGILYHVIWVYPQKKKKKAQEEWDEEGGAAISEEDEDDDGDDDDHKSNDSD